MIQAHGKGPGTGNFGHPAWGTRASEPKHPYPHSTSGKAEVNLTAARRFLGAGAGGGSLSISRELAQWESEKGGNKPERQAQRRAGDPQHPLTALAPRSPFWATLCPSQREQGASYIPRSPPRAVGDLGALSLLLRCASLLVLPGRNPSNLSLF